MTLQKWCGLASFLLAGAFVLPSLIYLTGDLRAASGPLAYALADFLYGPVWAASLVTAVFALRERIGERAQRRMTLALLAAALAAGAMASVACIRSANRHYHLMASPRIDPGLGGFTRISLNLIRANPPNPRHPRSIPAFHTRRLP